MQENSFWSVVCGLFKEAVSIWAYVASDHTEINE
jgi:hypothetical protein